MNMNTRLLSLVRIVAMSVLACVCFVLPARADFRLNNPVGTDGYYRVKWDCDATGPNGEQGYWAETNDMEYDETFVLAIDLTGTPYESWVNSAQNGYPVENTGVTFNAFRGGKGQNMYMDRAARLWHIRDNIYGATYNFAQLRDGNGNVQTWLPAIGAQTEIHARVFSFATLFGVACHNNPTTKRGSAWNYQDVYANLDGNKALFRFAPYTGTKTSVAFSTRDVTNGAMTYYDNDHYVETEGYGGPLCFEMNEDCCPRFGEPREVNIEVKQGSTPDALVYEVFGNKTAATYAWSRQLHDLSAPAETWPSTTPSAVPSSTEPVGTVYDYWCTLYHAACDGGSVESVHYIVTIVENCPDFAWSIDGADGIDAALLYPGGWYELSCTTDAGAPTLTVSGTGVTAGTPVTAGNTTTVRLTLAGNATGDITLTANSPAANGFQACSNVQTLTIQADCAAERVAKRIKWDGGERYVADNGNRAVIVNAQQTDNSDLWVFIPAGTTLTGGAANGCDLYYLCNAATGNYLHRSTVLYDDATWGFGAAETGSRINPQTPEYQWAVYQTNGYYYILCAAGYNASQWNMSYGLHYRGPEWTWMFCEHEPNVCNNELACGKLAGEDSSPAMKVRTLTDVTVALPVDFNTELAWSGTAPANPKEEVVIGNTLTFTAERTDAIHSINTVITYSSSDPTIATVDAETGLVTGIAEGDVTITATLETVGCFAGAELTYAVHVSDNCPDFTWAIDGTDGLTTPLYAGGWYDLTCTTAAGAPTLTITGTGVTATTPVTSGNTTTVRITLSGDASGDITLTAASPAANGYNACQDEQTLTISDCPADLFATTVAWTTTAPAATEELFVDATTSFLINRTDNLHSINATIRYSSSDANIASVDAATGVVTGVGEGTATITAALDTVGCFAGAQLTYSVHVTRNCPTFSWAIDGTDGLSTPLYPGGWYDLSCTTDAGAPTLTITGNGITTAAPVTAGNTTTVRITLSGDASGDITMTAAAPAANGYAACSEVMTPSVADCDGTAQSYKIEWFNYNGTTPFPQYWIHGGASVYLRDNNGRIEADIEHTDGQDEWFLLPTGNTVAGEPSYYIRNALTRRYLYRGPTHGNIGGAWEYAEALLGPNNAQTVDYQWVFFPAHTHSNGTVDTAIICVDGLTGTQYNIENEVYMLHTRMWEASGLFSNPAITTPGMACGKMAQQAGSPVFYIKHMSHPEHPAFSHTTTLEWDTPAPAATETVDVGEELDHTATRTDAIHSINTLITYSSSDPTIATVDAATGHVVAIAEGTAVITATLETVGCFPGCTVSYEVQVGECRTSQLVAQPTTVRVGEAVTLTLTGTYDDETGTYVLSDDTDGTEAPNADTWTPDAAGTYTFRWEGTSAEHPLCSPHSNEVTIVVYDCGPDATLDASATSILLGESVTLTHSTLQAAETGAYTLTAAPDGTTAPTSDIWTPDAIGTYTLLWTVSDTEHADCNHSSAELTITVNPIPEPEPTVLIFDNHNNTNIWSDIANWAPAYDQLPTCTDNIRITAPCIVDQLNAQADSCILAGGTLTIRPQGGLTVHGLLNRENGPLQPTDITIQADANGNGALVLGEHNSSVPATVEYYSLAYDGETNTPTWQYIAAPVADRPLLATTYPDAQLYAWTATPNPKLGGNWQQVQDNAVAEPFAGYCITQDNKKTYTITGTLADPVKRQQTCPYYSAGNYPGFSMAGNSWVAPIRVADMTAADFGIADATVYVYNTGTYDEAVAQQPNVAFGRGALRGQYNALPIHAAYYMPDALQTIPPMQGFFVYIAPGKGDAATLTLDYSRIVMDDNGCRTTATPMRAPAHATADPVQTMTITAANALWSDRVWMLRSGDFTPAFDNGWDGRKVVGKAPLSLTVETEQDQLAVAAMPEWEGTTLSFAGHRGLPYTLTLHLSQPIDRQLFLLDRLNDTRTPVTDGATYSFTASDNDSARFIIVGTEGENNRPGTDLEQTWSQPVKFIHRGHLYIRHDQHLYNASGQQLKKQ